MKKIFSIIIIAAVLWVLWMILAKKKTESHHLILGLIPQASLDSVSTNVEPLSKILSQKVGKEIKIFVGTNYDAVVEGLISKKIDVSFLAPAAYVKAKEHSNVQAILQAKIQNVWTYRCVIVSDAKSPIKKIDDLRGKKIAFGSSSSTSGFIYPIYILTKEGLNLKDFASYHNEEGGHNSVILSVMRGDADAGFIWDDGLEIFKRNYPDMKLDLKEIPIGEPIANDPIVAREGLDDQTISLLKEGFIQAIKDPVSKEIIFKMYGYQDFREVAPETYKDVEEAFKKIRELDL